MRPETLLHSSALSVLRKASGDSAPSERSIRRLEGHLAKACRIWGLEPLAPVVSASRSVVWMALHEASGSVVVLKLPLLRPSPIASGHHTLSSAGVGPGVLEYDESTGALLLERVLAPQSSDWLGRSSSSSERRAADEAASRILEPLAEAPAANGSECFTSSVRSTLERRRARPGLAAACERASEILQELESGDSRISGGFCHGALSPHSLHSGPRGPAARGEPALLTGPRGVSGDIHADLAAWMLRTADKLSPVKDACDRGSAAAHSLRWDAGRVCGWIEVLSAAGVSPAWGPPLSRVRL